MRAFQQDGVKLKDVVTLEEAPRMGCGIMELDHTSFEWTLTYDEYDLVLDGTLEIEIDGRVVSGGPGDIIYIPREATFTSRPPTGPATPTLSILPTGSKGMAVSGRPSFAHQRAKEGNGLTWEERGTIIYLYNGILNGIQVRLLPETLKREAGVNPAQCRCCIGGAVLIGHWGYAWEGENRAGCLSQNTCLYMTHRKPPRSRGCSCL